MCGYAGSSFEVKIETDSNDAIEIKTEADDLTECPHYHKPSTGMSEFSNDIFSAFICPCVACLQCFVCCIMSTVLST